VRDNILFHHEPCRSRPTLGPSNLVRLIVELPDETWSFSGGVERGGLWALDMGAGRFVVDNIPLYASDLNYCDLVSARRDGRTNELKYERVVELGGHSTFRVWVDDELDVEQEAAKGSLHEALADLGTSTEGAGPNFFALDVPPNVSAHAVFDLLMIGADVGLWEFEGPEDEQVY
jgi:hypothetical protein